MTMPHGARGSAPFARPEGLTGKPLTSHGETGVFMFSHIQRFLKDESGATAIEYGLIAAGISIAIIAVVNGLGTSLNAKFKSISTQLK